MRAYYVQNATDSPAASKPGGSAKKSDKESYKVGTVRKRKGVGGKELRRIWR